MHSLEKPPLVAGKVRGAVNREQEAAHKGKWDWTAAKGEEQSAGQRGGAGRGPRWHPPATFFPPFSSEAHQATPLLS